jgi:hypothetical protein
MKKKILFHILTFVLVFGFATLAVAQTGDNTKLQSKSDGDNTHLQSTVDINAKLDNPFTGGSTLDELFKTIINNIVMPIGGVLAVLAFIYSGFMYVTARGNETKVKQANSALLYSAIGTAILLGAWVIANAISTTIRSIHP